jgi:replicative DNA helicase Mcm
MISILLIGDPSVAKSIMGKSILPLKYRSRYIGGRGTSGAGITAAVVRDEEGNFALDCGAVTLANGSLLVIDEFEKMDETAIQPLHESMEQGSITISKAGINATLQARTSILAIANPKFGRWDKKKPLIDQIELVPSLLSRFDFIYVIRDTNSISEDEAIADGMLTDLKSGMRLTKNQILLFRKFIQYATNVTPVITDAAIRELKEFFLKMRELCRANREEGSSKVPLTFRQLGGLIRLTEAYAKLRLSKWASRDDALAAIEMVKDYLSRFGMDLETGNADIDIIEQGKTTTEKKVELILSFIPEKELIEELAVINKCKLHGLETHEIEKLINKLATAGDIFRPQNGWLKRL